MLDGGERAQVGSSTIQQKREEVYVPCTTELAFTALVSLMAQRVQPLSVSVLVHDHHSHAGNCIGLPSNIGLFPSTGSNNLFLLQRHEIPFDY